MTDVLSLIEGAIAILLAISPIIVAKYKEAIYAISIVQSFLDLLRVYAKAIADGTVTDDEYKDIGKEFVTVAKVTSFDKTITAEIPGLEQATVDAAVNVVNAAGQLVQPE